MSDEVFSGIFGEPTGVVVHEESVSWLDVAFCVEEDAGLPVVLEFHGLNVLQPVGTAVRIIDATQELRDVCEAVWADVEAGAAMRSSEQAEYAVVCLPLEALPGIDHLSHILRNYGAGGYVLQRFHKETASLVLHNFQRSEISSIGREFLELFEDAFVALAQLQEVATFRLRIVIIYPCVILAVDLLIDEADALRS